MWTPYSRSEFTRALKILKNWDDYEDVDRAWAFFVVQNQGFGGKANTEGDWGRSLSTVRRNMSSVNNKWRNRLKSLQWWHERLIRFK